MFEECILLILGTVIAVFYQRVESDYRVFGRDSKLIANKSTTTSGKILMFILSMWLVCYIGLRTTMNDTRTYITIFNNTISSDISGLDNIDWRLGSNPFFQIIQILIKVAFNGNVHAFIFITSLFVVLSYISFLKKYSQDFGAAVYVFLAYGVYSFAAAAIKQTISIAIAIWAIPAFAKGKRLRAIALIIIASFFHPYVLLLAAAFFLGDSIWSKKTTLIIVFTVLISILLGRFSNTILGMTSMIGEGYTETDIVGTGVNILRIGEALVLPVFTYLYRNKLRETNNKLVFIAVNMNLLEVCSTIIAGSGSAILFGRIPEYFSIFSCLSFSYLVAINKSESKKINAFLVLYIISLFVFFYFSKIKYLVYYANGNWFSSFYSRISILELFR